MDRTRLSIPSVIILVAGCTVLWMAFSVILNPKEKDFLNLYTGASLARDGQWEQMYKPEVQVAREREFVPGLPHVLYFVRPPVYALITAPLAYLPFEAAFRVWIISQWAILFACWAWGWRRFGAEAAVWGALFFSAPLGIGHGQDCTVFLALCIAAFMLGERRRWLASGAVLGLLAVRFHVILLWPVVLIFQRRWRMLAGMAAVAGAEGVISFLLLGPGGVRQYLAILKEVRNFYSPVSDMDLWGILNNFGIAWWPLLALSTVAIVAVVARKAAQPAPLWMTFSIAIAGSLLVSPRAYGYDAAMLLLPVWFIIYLSSAYWSRIVAAIICTPLTALSGVGPAPLKAFPAVLLLALVLLLCLETKKRTGGSRRRTGRALRWPLPPSASRKGSSASRGRSRDGSSSRASAPHHGSQDGKE